MVEMLQYFDFPVGSFGKSHHVEYAPGSSLSPLCRLSSCQWRNTPPHRHLMIKRLLNYSAQLGFIYIRAKAKAIFSLIFVAAAVAVV